MSIGSSYAYFFNYVAQAYPKHKILRCFEQQMPVKEVIFTSIDRICCPIGEVEQFIVNAIIKLGETTLEELDGIFHLGEAHIEQILLDYMELGVLQRANGTYFLGKKGAILIDPEKHNETVQSEHSMLFDIFPLKDRVGKYPVTGDRYKRSLHEYHYPTEFRKGKVGYDPQCTGTESITKEDIVKCLSLSNEEKRQINFSGNIIDVIEIKKNYSFSHPLAFVQLIDNEGETIIKVFDSCNSDTIREVKDAKAVFQNIEYLEYVYEDVFSETTKSKILDAFQKAKDSVYHIEESSIISVKPAVVEVGGDHWREHALSGFWYDDRSKIIIYLYPGDTEVAFNILVYRILLRLERINNSQKLDKEAFQTTIDATTKEYNQGLKEYGEIQAEKPVRTTIVERAIEYRFPKLSSDLDDLFEV